MTEQITIEIVTRNAAFEDSPTGEVARILRDLAEQFERDGIPHDTLFDLNGNSCGGVWIEEIDD